MYNNLRRFLAFLFALAVVYAGIKAGRLVYWGVVPVVLGEALRIWSAGYIRKNRVLSVAGPYRYVRNPLYLGSFLIGLGFGIFVNNIVLLAAIAAMFLYIYTLKINSEERELEKIFGERYLQYKRSAGRWLPLKKFAMDMSSGGISDGKFDFKLAIFKNNEYNAVLGCVLVVFVIIFFRKAV